MNHLWDVLNFILQNWEALAAIIMAALGYLSRRVSASRAKALETVAEVIEELDVKDVKEAVAAKAETLHPSVVGVLQDAVNLVDVKKDPPKVGAAFLREAARLVGKRG
jgi:hypothetical protein